MTQFNSFQTNPPPYGTPVIVYIKGKPPFIAARYRFGDNDWWRTAKQAPSARCHRSHEWCVIPVQQPPLTAPITKPPQKFGKPL